MAHLLFIFSIDAITKIPFKICIKVCGRFELDLHTGGKRLGLLIEGLHTHVENLGFQPHGNGAFPFVILVNYIGNCEFYLVGVRLFELMLDLSLAAIEDFNRAAIAKVPFGFLGILREVLKSHGQGIIAIFGGRNWPGAWPA